MSIEIRSLTKIYGSHRALNEITATIEKGMHGLIGHNGAGKTTLIKILATLQKPTSGDISLNGIPLKNTKEIRKIIGYLPQDFSFYPDMTVHNSMKYMAALSELPVSRQDFIIPFLLQKVNLWEKRKNKIRTLSGGMIRRLGIAQALVHEPDILLADEPVNGLDSEERLRIYDLLKEYAKDKIVILSTHITGDIQANCTKAGILDSGNLIFYDSVEKLM